MNSELVYPDDASLPLKVLSPFHRLATFRKPSAVFDVFVRRARARSILVLCEERPQLGSVGGELGDVGHPVPILIAHCITQPSFQTRSPSLKPFCQLLCRRSLSRLASGRFGKSAW